MANPSKVKGSRYEKEVQEWLRAKGEACERTAQTGKDDEGDLFVVDDGWYWLIENKAVQRIDLASFVDQALVERDNFAKARGIDPFRVMPLSIIKRRNKPIEMSYCVTTLGEYWRKS